MKMYQGRCRFCGKWNENMFLEETGGLFECEACGRMNEIPLLQAITFPPRTRVSPAVTEAKIPGRNLLAIS